MIRGLLILLCFACATFSFGQQNLLPLHSFYKDQLFANKLSKPYNEGSFLPASEGDYDLVPAILDSTPRYYTVTDILYRKHLIEITSKDCYITISPAANISTGIDFSDTSDRTLMQNTRGVFVEGDLFKKFSFATSFYENQARFTPYEDNYYSSVGEQYQNASGEYFTQNAVIPGAGRTKDFKGDGYDYAFATGYFSYAPIKQLRITAGNNPQFIGDGYRSLVLSDNSYSAPYLRLDWKINRKFNFTYYRSRLINLLRRSVSSAAEVYYETKGHSVNYFTYKPTEKISVSLFEGSIWNRGDSLTSKMSHPLYYNPVPFVSSLILDGENEVVSLLGINANYQVGDNHRVYAQLAMNDWNTEKFGYQLGYRGYNLFGLNDFMLQMEFNHVPSGMYESENPRLNYSHYNLPLAHAKGSGFREILLRSNYEYKHWFVDLKSVFYILNDFSQDAHLPVYEAEPSIDGAIFYQSLEMGYRFNRKMNLSIFGRWRWRTTSQAGIPIANTIQIGMRTALTNHYDDF
ncbi:MAG: hypothetical protein P8P74_18245 [Crocinitomicaceae bacterium]|nr:hypothetical protein [Crocinitomicaceae bacterium]